MEYVKTTNLSSTKWFKDFFQDIRYALVMDSMSVRIQVQIFITLTTIFIIGIIENIVVCTVIVWSKSMHTASNCYIFSLAVSDLFMLIINVILNLTLLVQKTQELPSPGPDLKLLFAGEWIMETSFKASMLTLTLFTMERYLAIFHPLYSYTFSEPSRTIKKLLIVWVATLFHSLPHSVFPFLLPLTPEMKNCSLILCNLSRLYEGTSMVLFHIVPTVLVVTMYIAIASKLIKNRRIEGNQQGNLKIVAAIVGVTIICWIPRDLTQLSLGDNYFNFLSLSLFQRDTLIIIDTITYTIFMLSPVINPIIYSIVSTKFRNAIKEILRSCRRTQLTSLVA